ncbi:MAG TPA: RidA family protein [Oligoflexia bacterium]|nr:RidA family protein [Oligoflexia bacterium]
MKRQNIPSGSKFEKQIGFSRACRVGNFISVAGTAPIDAEGRTVSPGNVYEHTSRCLAIMLKAIQEAGATADSVIRTRIMLTDISRWKEAAQAHGELFADIRPACTFVQVSGFISPEWLVETEADCIIE